MFTGTISPELTSPRLDDDRPSVQFADRMESGIRSPRTSANPSMRRITSAQRSSSIARPKKSIKLVQSKSTRIKAGEAIEKRIKFGSNASWAVNITLLLAKVAAFAVSLSFSVLASAADSLVDLLSQAVLSYAMYSSRKYSKFYPVGRSRMESVAVMVCAAIMSVATVEVIRESSGTIADAVRNHDHPHLDVGVVVYCVLGGAVVSKTLLYFYCVALRDESPGMLALAEDHYNDILSNLVAIAGATIAQQVPTVWWIDPAFALLLSCYIIYAWMDICKEQIQQLVGHSAPDEVLKEIEEQVVEHHPLLTMGALRAYHLGPNFTVEVDVIMPATMSLESARDIAIDLQHKIEAMDDIERAFVILDYADRNGEHMHKVEHNLNKGIADFMAPHPHFYSAPPKLADGKAMSPLPSARESRLDSAMATAGPPRHIASPPAGVMLSRGSGSQSGTPRRNGWTPEPSGLKEGQAGSAKDSDSPV